MTWKIPLLFCGVAAMLHAQATPPTALLVLSKGDRTLAIVDPASLEIVKRLPSGPDPHEVAVSTDGKLAFVSNYGGGAYNTITVVDLVAQKNLPAVDLGALRGPHGLMFAAGKLWFTAEAAKAIGSYDPATQKIDWILGTGQNRTHMVWVSENAQHLVTSNVSSASLTFIEKTARGAVRGSPGAGTLGAPRGAPPADWDETVVAVGRGAEGFDVSPDGVELWAANAQDGTVSIVNVGDKKVIQTLDANVKGANRLKFTPDGKQVLVSTLSGPDLLVMDARTRKELKRIPIGRGAAGIQMHPDGSIAYVACTPDDYVVVVDLRTLEVRNHLNAGKQPDGMAWASR